MGHWQGAGPSSQVSYERQWPDPLQSHAAIPPRVSGSPCREACLVAVGTRLLWEPPLPHSLALLCGLGQLLACPLPGHIHRAPGQAPPCQSHSATPSPEDLGLLVRLPAPTEAAAEKEVGGECAARGEHPRVVPAWAHFPTLGRSGPRSQTLLCRGRPNARCPPAPLWVSDPRRWPSGWAGGERLLPTQG